MEINKKLNLNKVPNAAENNSLVMAKNIRLTHDGRNITNEEGIKILFNTGNINDIIVGVIPCSTELVIFTYNRDNFDSNIYRYDESTNTKTLVPSAWKYNQGVITGTYTYNINNELIIAFGESDAKDINGNSINIPFKTLNLNRSSNADNDNMYGIAPTIPKCNMTLNKLVVGNQMKQGCYYFFIRYEISTEVYTKWFPIGIPLVAANFGENTIVRYRFPDSNTELKGAFADSVYIDANKIGNCPYNFEINLNLSNTSKYINFEIGVVLQSGTTTNAYRWNKFGISEGARKILFNGIGLEDYAIDNMLDNTFNLYNVKNITNYNNRLYIANYKESEVNVDLRSSANNAVVEYELFNVLDNDYTPLDSTFKTTGTSTTIFRASVLIYDPMINNTLYIDYKYPFIDWYNNIYGPANGFSPIDGTRKIKYTIATVDYFIPIAECYVIIYKYPHVNTGILFYIPGAGYVENVNVYTSLNIFDRSANNINSFCEFVSNNAVFSDIYDTKQTKRLHRKTLIPNNVYNFFIHYVKEDGSYTNGIKLINPTNPIYFDTINGNSTTIDVRQNVSYLSTVTGNSTNSFYDALIFDNTVQNHKLYHYLNTAKNNKFGYFANVEGEVFFKAPDMNAANEGNIGIGIKLTNVHIPAGYVGAFVSYEEVESVVRYTTLMTKPDSSNEGPCFMNHSELLLSNRAYAGNFIKPEYCLAANNEDGRYTVVTDKYNYKVELLNIMELLPADSPLYDNIGREAVVRCSNPEGYLDDHDKLTLINNIAYIGKDVVTVIAINDHIYNDKSKKLISLGYTVYKTLNIDQEQVVEYSNSALNAYLNYDGYIVYDQVLQYGAIEKLRHNKSRSSFEGLGLGILIGTDGTVSYTDGTRVTTNSFAYALKYKKYSDIFIELRTYDVSPETLYTVYNTDKKSPNLIVHASQSSRLYELKHDFLFTELKSYSQFDINKPNIDSYTKTIRRSNVIQTESISNAWRTFPTSGYKVIYENKGRITNIVGIGYYLLVHCEHSLFMFNRDASLQTIDKNVQLAIPDAFDTEYQEVFTSDKGYGGLQDSKATCISENGYLFYDAATKYLYVFDNGKLDVISNDIINLFKSYDIIDLKIGVDKDNNRILICFKANDHYVTLSYNSISKSWISAHDYKFDKICSTKSVVYLMLEESSKLYSFDKNNICNFGDLINNDRSIFPYYSNEIDSDIRYSYVDILCNEAYNVIKVLDTISYILSEELGYSEGNYNQAEQVINRLYSGDFAILYSDSCGTNLLPINVDNSPNSFNAYKYPYYNKGIWNFNYFRNNISGGKTSDKQSLIYGKYFVCRLVFANTTNKHIKLEDFTFHINKY